MVIRRLAIMFATAWLMERAVARWPRLEPVRRVLGVRRLRSA